MAGLILCVNDVRRVFRTDIIFDFMIRESKIDLCLATTRLFGY